MRTDSQGKRVRLSWSLRENAGGRDASGSFDPRLERDRGLRAFGAGAGYPGQRDGPLRGRGAFTTVTNVDFDPEMSNLRAFDQERIKKLFLETYKARFGGNLMNLEACRRSGRTY
jgi:hypothetical protein